MGMDGVEGSTEVRRTRAVRYFPSLLPHSIVADFPSSTCLSIQTATAEAHPAVGTRARKFRTARVVDVRCPSLPSRPPSPLPLLLSLSFILPLSPFTTSY